MRTEFQNSVYSKVFPLLHTSKKEQKEYVRINLIPLNNLEITKFNISENFEETVKADLLVEGKLNNFAALAGSMLIFPTEYFYPNDLLSFIPKEKGRNIDILEPISYSYFDTLRITFPEGYSLEHTENDRQFTSGYGQYEYHAEQIESKATIIRKIGINKGTYPLASFTEINDFLHNISEHQNKKLILTKTSN